MKLMFRCHVTAIAAFSLPYAQYMQAWALPDASNSFCSLMPGPVPNCQPLAGQAFIGNAVKANPLRPKFEYKPRGATLHLDGGSTNTLDFPGPLGHDLSVTSVNTVLDLLFWDSKNRLTAAYYGPCNGSNTTVEAVVAVNPQNLAIEASWVFPKSNSNDTLNFSYMELLTETDEIIVPSQQGHIYILKRFQDGNQPTIELTRQIDLASTGVLQNIPLLNTLLDADGNIWFTTGGLRGFHGGGAQPATIVGYIEPNGTIHSKRIPNQMAENGISISNTTVFLITGPTDADDHANAVGFMSALRPGPGTSISVVWNATYQAGSEIKPSAFARGSGSTPVLLGNDFVAVTDNADPQMNLLIYRQNATGNQKPVCKVPLFKPGASWNDNGPIGHFDGKDYGVVIQNEYNEPPYNPSDTNINGAYNNFTGMSPGISKIIVAGDGSGCHTNWTIPLRMTTLPVLSTATGLMYGYTQSEDLAIDGHYVWYVTAIDYISGKTVWKARAGAGGLFNNYYKTINLNPDGTFYQMVRGGVVIAKDGTYQ